MSFFDEIKTEIQTEQNQKIKFGRAGVCRPGFAGCF